MKIQPKLFKDSNLLDFGSGSGIYGLVYNLLGARTDLVEYEQNFVDQSKKKYFQNLQEKIHIKYIHQIFLDLNQKKNMIL